MKKILGRHLLLPILLSLTISGIPANAITRQKMVNLIQRTGVTVSRRSNCGSNGKAAAHYEPRNNAICIAESEYRDTRDWDQALTHEAIHMVQDCIAGLNNASMMTLGQNTGYEPDFVTYIRQRGNRWVTFIKRHYRPAYYELELEAYALQGRPDVVSKLIQKECLS